MKKKKRFFSCVLVLLSVTMMIPHTTKGYEKEQQEDYSEMREGIPDIVNSFTSNNDYHLTVIANSEKIEDKEEFARTVVCMCQNNSFRSTKLSVDRGYPTSLDIDVFLTCKDVEERKEPVCKIEFKTDDFSKGYNIKDNPDEFRLYLDGREINY